MEDEPLEDSVFLTGTIDTRSQSTNSNLKQTKGINNSDTQDILADENPDPHETVNGTSPREVGFEESTPSDSVDPLQDVALTLTRRGSLLSQPAPPDGIDPRDEICGWGPFQPPQLQRFRTARWALVVLGLAGVAQGVIVNGLVFNSISSIERRFNLKSSETGIVASAYDFASLLCLIPVSYFGGVSRKPYWVGSGIFIMGLGSLLYSFPHFTTGVYRPTVHDELGVCQLDSTSTYSDTECGTSALSNYKYVFLLGQLLHGVGASPLFTLGVSYLDDNLLPSQTSLYVGIFYALSLIGPAIGFILGGLFLQTFTDAAYVDVEELQLTPSSPKWVGAWWTGFLLASILSFLVSITMCGFPKSMPGREEVRKQKVSEAHGADTANDNSGFTGTVKEFPKQLKKLLLNPTFMMISAAGTMESLLLSGFATFAPKFVQNQFALTSSTASYIIGAIVVPAGGGGTLFGGWIVKHKKLKLRAILRLCILFASISFLFCFGYLVQCQNNLFAGVNSNYKTNQTSTNLTADCNAECHCSRELYNPVCDSSNVMYFSPCHAGCTGAPSLALDNGSGDKLKYYSNCSCVESPPFNEQNYQVKEGQCDSDCTLLPLFLFMFFIVTIFTFLASMPALSVTLRSVPEDQKSFALGVQWLMVRAFGTIPAAPIIGGIIDRSCILWQEVCDTRGSCYAYDNSKMGTYLMAAALIVKFLSVLFLVLAYVFYKPPVLPAEPINDVDFITTQQSIDALGENARVTTEL